MVALLKFVTASMAVLAVLVNWMISPITVYLVRKEERKYNEVNSS